MTAPPGPAPARWRRVPGADVGAVVALVVIGVVVPAVLAGAFHVFSVPRNDDWAYRRDLWDFVRTGHLSFVGWGVMSLVGQVLWGAAFAAVLGTGAWVPGAAVAVLATAGLAAAYVLARSVLPRPGAAACVLVVLALPGFALSTSSFMTDVPAFSAEAVCLALAAAALRREGAARWGWLAVSLGVGCFGFSVREFDIAAPLAAIGALALQDRRHRPHYGLAAAGLLLACGAIYLWAAQVPGAQSVALALSGPVRFIKGLGNSYFTLSLGLAPLLPAALRRYRPRFSARPLVPSLAALVAGTLLLAADRSLFTGNYLLRQGASGAAVLTGRPPLFPGPVWWALQLVALASGAVLAAVAASTGRPSISPARLCYPRAMLVIFSVLTGLSIGLFQGLTKGTVFDRYLWPLVLSLAVLLLSRRPVPSGPAPYAPAHGRRLTGSGPPLPVLLCTAVLATVVGGVAAVITLNADAYDAARWSAGHQAVAAGVPAAMVDAGFEWVGSHQSDIAVPGRQVRGSPFYLTWYDQMFPAFKECAFVSGNLVALPWLRRLTTVSYQELGFAGREDLYVYLVRAPGC
ncbi:MAG: hypothetical protein ACLQVK_21215 [Acidimicrobiales bacterium]